MRLTEGIQGQTIKRHQSNFTKTYLVAMATKFETK